MVHEMRPRRVGVVMAGGAGERFWPLSRRHRPKQLLHLVDDRESMLEGAVRRIAPLIPPEHVYVVTGAHLVSSIREARIGIPEVNVIAEPCKRNTAGCLAYAAARLMATYGGDGDDLTMAVLTADHIIRDEPRFREAVQAAMNAAEACDALATLGLKPERPETGYGYIEAECDDTPSAANGPPGVRKVRAFCEKPDRERAEAFCRSGRHYWNSGMFFWRVAVFLEEMAAAAPHFERAIRGMTTALRANDEAEVRRLFEGLDDIAIDYALMERARHVVVVPADFGWDDIGTWAKLDRGRAPDAAGNVLVGDPVAVDCTNSFIYNDAGARVAVGVVGVVDTVVIATEDAVLVVPKDRVQDVRAVVEELKRRDAPQR
ncbi:MAG TPA: mannose-1-phosphate guanylyltransferase [Candidatus Hydrogenedentes bacterium]|nr:mannose-1-phosphate guanylyltransferase [Candidatus Hydrogenedentota bacterium]HPG67502.1 mannose-1-phosphate guanylyltransferase [Candidatus Hydrogenedentota bacterium]